MDPACACENVMKWARGRQRVDRGLSLKALQGDCIERDGGLSMKIEKACGRDVETAGGERPWARKGWSVRGSVDATGGVGGWGGVSVRM